MLSLIILNLPAVFCLLFGWWFTLRPQNEGPGREWRRAICFYGLIASTLGLALDLIFLAHGYSESHSFKGPPVGAWLIIGRTNGAIWIFSFLAAAMGRGKVRLPLFVYCLTSLAGNFLFMISTMD